jgi:hypothetical protein
VARRIVANGKDARNGLPAKRTVVVCGPGTRNRTHSPKRTYRKFANCIANVVANQRNCGSPSPSKVFAMTCARLARHDYVC